MQEDARENIRRMDDTRGTRQESAARAAVWLLTSWPWRLGPSTEYSAGVDLFRCHPPCSLIMSLACDPVSGFTNAVKAARTGTGSTCLSDALACVCVTQDSF